MERVNFMRCTFLRSRLSTRTTSEPLFGIHDFEDVGAGRQPTPGICTVRLNVKYVVRRESKIAPVADVASTPRSTTPHNVWTILANKHSVLLELLLLRRPCAVRSAVVNAPTGGANSGKIKLSFGACATRTETAGRKWPEQRERYGWPAVQVRMSSSTAGVKVGA